MKFLLLILFYRILNGSGIEWNSNNYPNPITDFEICGMNISSQICDPDTVFSMEDRNIIDTKLKWLEASTSEDHSSDCSGKGVFGLIIIGKTFKGGNSDFFFHHSKMKKKYNVRFSY